MKAWWKSKTLWFNVLSLGVFVASGQAGVAVPANVAVPVVGIGNMALRMLTSQPVGATDQP